jgi:hypothetical protein
MQTWIELIKAMVRPFIIVWGFVAYGLCIFNGIAVPDLLSSLVAAAVIEYFGERAVLRLRANRDNAEGKTQL